MSLTVTDLFCGAGGSSLGAELAGAELRLGLNHWDRAIETHATNFPHADHDCEDVSSLTTSQIRRYPDSDILLASPECTNHSLAKGARRRKPQAASLFEDGPAGDAEQDRSRATMWDVVRFTEQKILKGRPYKAIVVENVTDAFEWGADDDGGLFAAWRQAMSALGYESEIVWLNSMFCPPTPQSRDRMYVVFWRRGMRRPNLRFEPPAWCPSCERIVDGVFTWKRPDRPLVVVSGKRKGMPTGAKYGDQYLYTCPACRSVVLPGVFPAATAIDFALPAVRIGDRKRDLKASTRSRIQRGLERLAREPFAIRLSHGGVPRPLTLPLVTLTQRHDVAVVLPTSGNLHETTPGNRARRADLQPADTVACSGDRALVMPYSEVTAARDANTTPAPTQRTNPTLSLVVPNRANGRLRDPAVEHAPTVMTGGTIGLVEVQRNGSVRASDELPAHTVRCGGQHHAVVMRNNNSRGNSGAMLSPAHDEPFRALTTTCHQSLVVPYQSEPHSPGEPVRTITTRDRLALVVPPMGDVTPRDAETLPGPTQTTTTRPGLALAWDDAAIDDCLFRMFALDEIARTMVMHANQAGGLYVVHGNKREVMAQYGGAVTPPVTHELVRRLLEVM